MSKSFIFNRNLIFTLVLSLFTINHVVLANSDELENNQLKTAIIQSLKDKGVVGPVIQTRIVGGTQVANNTNYRDFSLWFTFDDMGNVGNFCGATMIAPNKALTAAHCTKGRPDSQMGVIPNFYSYQNDLFESRLYLITSSDEHPSYIINTVENDIAVLTLARSTTNPTSLLYAGNNNFINRPAIALGVGATAENGPSADVLREVEIPVVSNAACSVAYPGLIKDSMICAGYTSGGRSTCQGDSGGPLKSRINGKLVQIGITSFGRGCARPNTPGGYTRVTSFYNFIRQHAPNARFYREPSSANNTPSGPVKEAPVVPAPASLLLLED